MFKTFRNLCRMVGTFGKRFQTLFERATVNIILFLKPCPLPARAAQRRIPQWAPHTITMTITTFSYVPLTPSTKRTSPPTSRALMSAGVVVPLNPEGGFSGIATSFALLRLVAKSLARQVGPAVEQTCAHFQSNIVLVIVGCSLRRAPWGWARVSGSGGAARFQTNRQGLRWPFKQNLKPLERFQRCPREVFKQTFEGL